MGPTHSRNIFGKADALETFVDLEATHWEMGVEIQASYGAQAMLGRPASISQVLGWQACSTTMGDTDL